MLMQDGGRGSTILTFCIDQDLQKTCRIPILSQMCSRALEASVKFLTLQNIRTPPFLMSNVYISPPFQMSNIYISS